MKNNIILLRFKTFFSDKITSLILLITVILFLVIINNLAFHAGDRSSIPIGVLDLDQSNSSKELIESLKKVPSFYVYQEREKELKKKILKNEIKAYFILNSGYEKMIQAGKTDGLIVMNYLEEDESAKVLSDIVAGEMLYRICQYKSFNRYNSLGKSIRNAKEAASFVKLNAIDYLEYADAFLTSPDFDFDFDTKLVQVGSPDKETEISNSVLYLEAVWGITAILLSFLVMILLLGLVLDKELGVFKRTKVALIKPYLLNLSHFITTFVLITVLALLLCISLFKQIPDFTLAKTIRAFLLTEFYGAVMILWFGLLGKMVNTAGKYQIIGTASIFIFGFLGFLPLISGFLNEEILNITKFIPNCWFINEFTDIILNTKLENNLNNSYFICITTACGLLVLHGIINKRQFS